MKRLPPRDRGSRTTREIRARYGAFDRIGGHASAGGRGDASVVSDVNVLEGDKCSSEGRREPAEGATRIR